MDSTEIRSNVPELISAWRAARLPVELIEPMSAAYQRYTELSREVGDLDDDVSGAFTEIVGQVASGGLSLADGVTALAQRTAAMERISQASSAKRGRTLFESAQGKCLQTIRVHLEGNTAELFDACSKPGGERVRGILSRLGLIDPVVSVAAPEDAAVAS